MRQRFQQPSFGFVTFVKEACIAIVLEQQGSPGELFASVDDLMQILTAIGWLTAWLRTCA